MEDQHNPSPLGNLIQSVITYKENTTPVKQIVKLTDETYSGPDTLLWERLKVLDEPENVDNKPLKEQTKKDILADIKEGKYLDDDLLAYYRSGETKEASHAIASKMFTRVVLEQNASKHLLTYQDIELLELNKKITKNIYDNRNSNYEVTFDLFLDYKTDATAAKALYEDQKEAHNKAKKKFKKWMKKGKSKGHKKQITRLKEAKYNKQAAKLVKNGFSDVVHTFAEVVEEADIERQLAHEDYKHAQQKARDLYDTPSTVFGTIIQDLGIQPGVEHIFYSHLLNDVPMNILFPAFELSKKEGEMTLTQMLDDKNTTISSLTGKVSYRNRKIRTLGEQVTHYKGKIESLDNDLESIPLAEMFPTYDFGKYGSKTMGDLLDKAILETKNGKDYRTSLVEKNDQIKELEARVSNAKINYDKQAALLEGAQNKFNDLEKKHNDLKAEHKEAKTKLYNYEKKNSLQKVVHYLNVFKNNIKKSSHN